MAVVINFEPIKQEFKQFLKNDKKDGIKKAWYFYHNKSGQIQAIDTVSQLEYFTETYRSQGILPYKTINKRSMYGARLVTLHVFRKEGGSITNGIDTEGNICYDKVALALGYLPANCETVIAEVIF